jgi:hypothetical protein
MVSGVVSEEGSCEELDQDKEEQAKGEVEAQGAPSEMKPISWSTGSSKTRGLLQLLPAFHAAAAADGKMDVNHARGSFLIETR